LTVEIYQYWPYLRREELVLCEGLLGPGDRIVVHTTPRPTDPIESELAACEVRATVPAVAPRHERSVRWALSRARTYGQRARGRRRVIAAEHFDIAHLVYLNPFTDPFDLRGLAKRVPLVSTVHDVVPHHSRVPAPVEHRLLREQYRHAGTILVHHETIRQPLLTEFGLDPDHVVVIPPPIYVGPPLPRAEKARPTVLFFGTFRRNKGVDVLLEAVQQLQGEVDASFHFAGHGVPEVEDDVRRAAAGDDRVTAEIEYVTEARKREMHTNADLVVLPYTSFSSQSGVLQDAYAHSLPVVVSDVGALGETVRHDGTGWVVAPGDATGLAETIASALRDEAGRRAAGAAAGRVAQERTASGRGSARCSSGWWRSGADRSAGRCDAPRAEPGAPEVQVHEAGLGQLPRPHPHRRPGLPGLQPREPAEVPELRLPGRRHLGPGQPGGLERIEVRGADVVGDLAAEHTGVLDVAVAEALVDPWPHLVDVEHQEPRGRSWRQLPGRAGDRVHVRVGRAQHPGAHQRGPGGAGRAHEVGEPVGAPVFDVGVAEHRVARGAPGEPAVEPLGVLAPAGGDLEPEPAAGLEVTEHPQRSVGGTGVADDEIEVPPRVVAHRPDAELGDACGVETRHVNGD
jgi:glycosyltransferase involved in cell wall biosynthesis